MFCRNKSCRDYQLTGFHAEFVDGVTVCPTCGEDLVDSLDSDEVDDDAGGPSVWTGGRTPAPLDFEPVLETTNRVEIFTLRSLLDAAWIPHVVLEADQLGPLRDSQPLMTYEPADGAWVFLVPTELADEARDALAKVDDTQNNGSDDR